MRRKAAGLAGAAVLAVLTAGGAAIVAISGKPAALTVQEPPVVTAPVQQRALSAMISVEGTLGYQGQSDGSPYVVINQARGTYTQLPTLGQAISQGHALYRVDDEPVVLLYGSTPAYRSLSAGATGSDVAELNADLVQLGYATPAQLGPSTDAFGSTTTKALEELQSALGQAQNGLLALGQAVFEPAAMRVTALAAQPGGNAQPGQTVMQATTTVHQVQVALDASQQTDVAAGDKVTITLPNNQLTPGVIATVGTVATCPSSPGTGGSSSTSATPGTDACSSASSGSVSTPTVTVAVTPTDAAATGTWDQAPVRVGITTASLPSALVVPVTALLAQPGGGYSVEVVDAGRTNRLVPVSLGLFDDADGLVQVTGTALAPGERVVVPGT